MFALKKFISYWLMPMPLGLVLIAAGFSLACRPKRARWGRGLVLAGSALILLLSNEFVSNRLLGQLEDQFPAIPEVAPAGKVPAALRGCEFVVVLGGGHSGSPGMPALDQLSPSDLARMSEGLRLIRCLPAATLVTSGAGSAGHPTNAQVVAQAAESLGMDPARIRMFNAARDTEDEAAAAAALVNGARIALVTSAWHMPRAARLFRGAGVSFVACPTDFEARSAGGFQWTFLTFDGESLVRSTRAVHEWLGLLWLRLRGTA